jgi:hypothetical protein
MIDADIFFGMFWENAVFEEANDAHATASLKEQRRRNYPAAIAGLIEGALCSVNAFPAVGGRGGWPESADKSLMRLNFP